ncbi:MAG: hypothetical protein HWN68_04970 [Desulfobacterales bacterium]|nr:hypothetical protein [Desulfobacterales bacterium]
MESENDVDVRWMYELRSVRIIVGRTSKLHSSQNNPAHKLRQSTGITDEENLSAGRVLNEISVYLKRGAKQNIQGKVMHHAQHFDCR